MLPSRSISRVLSRTTIYLRRTLPHGSSEHLMKVSASNRSSLSRLAPSGVYRAPRVTVRSVGSYPAFPSLQVSLRFISVALSRESPPVGVTNHSALWGSDFPRGGYTAPQSSKRLGKSILTHFSGKDYCFSVIFSFSMKKCSLRSIFFVLISFY